METVSTSNELLITGWTLVMQYSRDENGLYYWPVAFIGKRSRKSLPTREESVARAEWIGRQLEAFGVSPGKAKDAKKWLENQMDARPCPECYKNKELKNVAFIRHYEDDETCGYCKVDLLREKLRKLVEEGEECPCCGNVHDTEEMYDIRTELRDMPWEFKQ